MGVDYSNYRFAPGLSSGRHQSDISPRGNLWANRSQPPVGRSPTRGALLWGLTDKGPDLLPGWQHSREKTLTWAHRSAGGLLLTHR